MSVRMRHPDLDTEYVAQPEQVPHLRAAGWLEVEGQAEQGEEWPTEAQRFEGQEQVTMRHPDLDGEIVVARSAVPIHEQDGWLEVGGSPAAVEPEAPSEPSTRRRRGPKQEETE